MLQGKPRGVVRKFHRLGLQGQLEVFSLETSGSV